MPKSPFQRAAEETIDADSRSTAGSKGKAKRRSKPTKPTGNRKKKIKKRYSAAREEAQLAGVIPTTPDGAVRDERVPPSIQGHQLLPALIAEAIRRGWAVPDGIKPALVDEMVAVILDPERSDKAKIAAFNALRMADRSQWEQDNPVDAGKAKGASSTVAVSVQSNMLAVQIMREHLQNDIGGGETGLPAPTVPSPPSHSRFDGTVEVGAAFTSDERDTRKSVADPE